MAFFYPSRPMIAQDDAEGRRLVRKYHNRETALCLFAFIGMPAALLLFFAWGGYMLAAQAYNQGGIFDYVVLIIPALAAALPAYYTAIFLANVLSFAKAEIGSKNEYIERQLSPISNDIEMEMLSNAKGKLPIVDNFLEAIELEGRKPTTFELTSVSFCLQKLKS